MLTLFRKVWDIYKPLHKAIWLILFLLVVSTALDLAWPYIYGRAISDIVRGAEFADISILLFVALGTLIFQNIVGYIQGLVEINQFDYESPALAQRLTLKKLFGLSIGQHRNEHSGLTQSVISEGQGSLREILGIIMYSYLPMLLRIPLALGALFFLSWQVGSIVLVGLLISIMVSIYQNKRFTPMVREERDMSQDLGKKRMEMLRNAPLVISNSSEEYAQRLIDSETEKKDSFSKRYWKKYIRISYLLRGMIGDITLIVSIAASAYLVSVGQLGAGQVVTVVLWTSSVLSNLGYLTNLQRQILFASERVSKYFNILDLESDVKQSPSPIRLESIKGAVSFENVSFIYPKKRIIEDDKSKKTKTLPVDEHPDQKEALENLSFDIQAGEHVAFVGASGAGKSTTILLMLRGSDPQSGKISVDGVDLRDMDLTFYRRNLGVVEQHIALFDDTIRRNISFGLPEGELLTDERLDELAKISRIDEFKDKLTQGWDTVIGENGIKLSGGQRQRVGIARALAKNPSILILDEATSSLDAKNEALIKDALHDASKGRTTIMIAHRLSTVRDADRIFVFDKGKIVGVGKHDDLLTDCAIYADLVSHQTVLL